MADAVGPIAVRQLASHITGRHLPPVEAVAKDVEAT
jgi:hypothetical protein